MKILHIAPQSPYNIGWGYQENLLPKYQRKLGHEVQVIVTNGTHDNGAIKQVEECTIVLEDGTVLMRKRTKGHTILGKHFYFGYMDIYEEIESYQPDLIFYHGLGSTTIMQVLKYVKKHKNCIIVQDNHLDYNIGKIDPRIAFAFHAYWKILNSYTQRYVEKIYGVNPWRVEFAEKMFGIKKEKLDCLLQGADDEHIDFKHKEELKKIIRDKYQVNENEFLVVTGGKLDKNKGTIELMEAVTELKDIKLIIFGSVSDEIKEEFNKILLKSNNIIFIGWLDSKKVYDYFLASDLAAFPGQHSVFWEQACACKIPAIFKKFPNLSYCNVGGNADFFEDISVEKIQEKIKELQFTAKYYDMKSKAESSITDCFLYTNIAKKSIETVVLE